jgi:hypothetical protein
MSRGTITERQGKGGPRPWNVTVTIATDDRGRMTIEVTDLPMDQVPAAAPPGNPGDQAVAERHAAHGVTASLVSAPLTFHSPRRSAAGQVVVSSPLRQSR